MKIIRNRRLLAHGVLMLSLATATLGLRPASSEVTARYTVEAVRPLDAAEEIEVVGEGITGRIICIGCVAGILATGGASLTGLALMAVVHPDFLLACGVTCAIAF